MRKLLLVGAVALMACRPQHHCGDAPPPAEPPPPRVAESAAPYHEEFGGDALGFVDWMSADGRIVILYRFVRDTDGDGEVTARLGDHGEVLGDDPVPEIHDLVDGSFGNVDAIVATGPRQRRFVVRNGKYVVLMNAATGGETILPDADPEPDEANPCLPSRNAAFGPAGDRLAYPNVAGNGVTYDLVAGQLRVFESDEKLWRVGAPPLDGSIVLQTIPADTDGDGEIRPPTARTTCSSPWAARFASSIGRYGWEGDDFQSKLVMPDGDVVPFRGTLVPVGPQHVWSPGEGLQSAAGEPVNPPRGCTIASVPLGEPLVLLQCGPHLGLWRMNALDTPVMLGDPASPTEPVTVPFRPDSSQAWVAIEVRTDEGKRLARLDLPTGRIEMGPPAQVVGRPHASGWVLATTPDDQMIAFDLTTGQTTEIEGRGDSPDGLLFRRGETWRSVNPATGATLEHESRPSYVTVDGCVVRPSKSTGRFDRGPWRYSCP